MISSNHKQGENESSGCQQLIDHNSKLSNYSNRQEEYKFNSKSKSLKKVKFVTGEQGKTPSQGHLSSKGSTTKKTINSDLESASMAMKSMYFKGGSSL